MPTKTGPGRDAHHNPRPRATSHRHRRSPGTETVVMAELARLEATLEALAATLPPKLLPYGDNARLG